MSNRKETPMANITKRQTKSGISYRIRVFVDKNGYGKQLTKSTTWTPPAGMRPSAAEKEVRKVAALFEDQARRGLISLDSGTKFGEYAAQWVENAQIAPKTREGYQNLLKRILPALGHIRLEKLEAHHLEAFYKNLGESGISVAGTYAVSERLKSGMKTAGISGVQLGKLAGVSSATAQAAAKGDHVSVESAERISNALGADCGELFQIHKRESGLTNNSIMHYHRLISAILEKAKRERRVPFNIAKEHTTPPKVKRNEAKYLDDEQSRQFLALLQHEEDVRIKTALTLLLFTGMRRGELCGLSWEDIDEKNQVIRIRKTSQYIVGHGVRDAPTKNSTSVRTIKVTPYVFETLTAYRLWWTEQRLFFGKEWQGDGHLFVRAGGALIQPDTINFWLDKFLQAHNLPHISPHSLRHTFASLQIAAGVDVRTLQARTGHAQASTLLNIYAHAFESAQESAATALDQVLLPSVSGMS